MGPPCVLRCLAGWGSPETPPTCGLRSRAGASCPLSTPRTSHCEPHSRTLPLWGVPTRGPCMCAWEEGGTGQRPLLVPCSPPLPQALIVVYAFHFPHLLNPQIEHCAHRALYRQHILGIILRGPALCFAAAGFSLFFYPAVSAGSGGGEGDCVGSRRPRRVGRGRHTEEPASLVWGRGRAVPGLPKGHQAASSLAPKVPRSTAGGKRPWDLPLR